MMTLFEVFRSDEFMLLMMLATLVLCWATHMTTMAAVRLAKEVLTHSYVKLQDAVSLSMRASDHSATVLKHNIDMLEELRNLRELATDLTGERDMIAKACEPFLEFARNIPGDWPDEHVAEWRRVAFSITDMEIVPRHAPKNRNAVTIGDYRRLLAVFQTLNEEILDGPAEDVRDDVVRGSDVPCGDGSQPEAGPPGRDGSEGGSSDDPEQRSADEPCGTPAEAERALPASGNGNG